MHSDHRRHDRLLIARFAAGDSHPAQLDEARALVAGCAECARLAEDIRLISGAVHHLPAARRPRSFQLSAEQAEQLRGSRLERFLRRLSGPGWGTLRPVAGVALSLGLVMAAIGSLPLGGMTAGQPASGPFDAPPPDVARVTDVASATEAPAYEAPEGQGEAPADVAQPEDGLSDAYVEALRDKDDGDVAGPSSHLVAPGVAAMGGGSLLLYAGLILAVVAMGLLTIAWIARARFSDPLLR
jgi:hypothetical protein